MKRNRLRRNGAWARNRKKEKKKERKGKKKGGSQIKIDGQMRCLTGRRSNGARSRLPLCLQERERESASVCSVASEMHCSEDASQRKRKWAPARAMSSNISGNNKLGFACHQCCWPPLVTAYYWTTNTSIKTTTTNNWNNNSSITDHCRSVQGERQCLCQLQQQHRRNESLRRCLPVSTTGHNSPTDDCLDLRRAHIKA